MKNTFRKWVVSVLAACVSGILFTGCAWSIGDKEGPAREMHPTRGQELIDLKKASDQGAITPDEYEAQKKKILEK